MGTHSVGVTTSKRIEKPFETLSRVRYLYHYYINKSGEYQVFRIRNTHGPRPQKIRITSLVIHFNHHKEGTLYRVSDEEALKSVAELAAKFRDEITSEYTVLDDGQPVPPAFEKFTEPMDISHSAKKQT